MLRLPRGSNGGVDIDLGLAHGVEEITLYMKYRWRWQETVSQDDLQGVEVRSPYTRQLLWNRGIRTAQEAGAFFDPSFELHQHDPRQFRHLSKAAQRIFTAIEKGERITVHGDYDADGVTGSTLMITVLRELERRLTERATAAVSLVDYYIPHRDAEGYGLHVATVDTLNARGTKLIITVDCGIACVDEIAYSRMKGIDVIVVDHHQFGTLLPDAFLIHPGLPEETYPFKKLAAVGVAYKFATALLSIARERGIQIAIGWEKWLLDLVAIATVTDMVGLVGENRLLERFGLLVLRKTRRPGLLALFESAKIEAANIDTESVGFMIGPRLNAAGRMDHASLALRLLLSETMEEARPLAAELERCNRQRQDTTKEMMKEADEIMKETDMSEWPIRVLWHEGWSPSLVGLVAGRVMERTGRPVIAIGRHESSWIGSGRSPAIFDVTMAMRTAGEGILTRVGGHVQACGFALASGERLPELREKLIVYATETLKGVLLQPELLIDTDIPLEAINWDLWEDLTKSEPFGMENPRPVFCVRDIFISKSDRIGEGKHLRLDILSTSGKKLKLMAFSFPSDAWVPGVGERADIAFSISVNEWQGVRTLEGRVVDLRPVEGA